MPMASGMGQGFVNVTLCTTVTAVPTQLGPLVVAPVAAVGAIGPSAVPRVGVAPKRVPIAVMAPLSPKPVTPKPVVGSGALGVPVQGGRKAELITVAITKTNHVAVAVLIGQSVPPVVDPAPKLERAVALSRVPHVTMVPVVAPSEPGAHVAPLVVAAPKLVATPAATVNLKPVIVKNVPALLAPGQPVVPLVDQGLVPGPTPVPVGEWRLSLAILVPMLVPVQPLVVKPLSVAPVITATLAKQAQLHSPHLVAI